MPLSKDNPELKSFLASVRSHLPIGQARDILAELDSAIRDRVEDMAAASGREPDDAMWKSAIEELGDTKKVASAYLRERYLIGPDEYRTFIFYTGVTFGLHLVLVGVATALERAIQFGPVGVNPIGPHGALSLFSAVVHALLLDIGLVVCVFVTARLTRRSVEDWSPSLGTESSPRAAAGRVVLALLFAVVLNFFRDNLFVIRAPGSAGELFPHPLFTEGFAAVLPLINAVLVISAVKDMLYWLRGETRVTLAADAFHGVVGVGVIVYLLAYGPLMELPADVEEFALIRPAMNNFLKDLGSLVLSLLAILLAVKTMRRLTRFAQI